MFRSRHRADGNHFPVLASLRRLGLAPFDTHNYGIGCDFMLPHVRDGSPHFFELKDPAQPPSGRKLTESELAMQARYPQHWHLALTVEDVLRAIGLVAAEVD